MGHDHLTEQSPRRAGRARRIVVVAIALFAIGMLGATPSPAATAGPHWVITSSSAPTYFKPGDTADHYTLVAMDDGSASTDGSPVTVTDALPAGVTATEISGLTGPELNEPLECDVGTVTCRLSTPVAAGELLVVAVTVSVGSGAHSGEEVNRAEVSGGGAVSGSVSDPTRISLAAAPFGVSNFTAKLTDVSGSAETEAGSHPFEMTMSFAFNVGSLEAEGGPLVTADPKDIEVALPPGLVGDPAALPQCSQVSFQTVASFKNCPSDTQVGTLRLFFYGGGTGEQEAPIYNVAPPPGQPTELGFSVSSFVHIPMFFHVRSDGDYGLTAQAMEVSESDPIQAAIFTLWGVPADASHDKSRRGLPNCNGEGCPSGVGPEPFLRLPTGCQGGPLPVAIATDSWQSPESPPRSSSPSREPLPALTDCEQLSFSPSISVQPETTQANGPSGYTVDLRVPQNRDPSGRGTPDLKSAVVALPAGTVISPSATDGLQGCSDAQFGAKALSPASCPQASQIGTLRIVTPLLANPLEGQVFLGAPSCAPCTPSDAQAGNMIRLFLQAQGSGVIVKLQGKTSVDQSTGQLTTTFEEDPQLPFEDLKLTLNGGERAPLANPSTCGTPLRSTSRLTPYSSETPAEPMSEPFEVSACPPPRFSPAFSAGTTNNQAGAFSPEIVSFSRTDQSQDFEGITVHTPPGLLGMLSHVELCPEPQAQAGACAAQSQIGATTVAAGPGSSLLYLGGKVFLTGPYEGAPFGLSILVPAVAGPFNLGNVNIRAAIGVDRGTAALTITSDPLPQSLDGIPLQIKRVDLNLNREHFMFNPTNCQPLVVNATLRSVQGATAAMSSPFQSANCATLPFKPKLTALTQARTSKASGAYLHVRVVSATGQANIAKVEVDLPRQLPSRLTTLQRACLADVFDANPAACPAASLVGMATVVTPVLQSALNGPAYLVSHGSAAFPDLEVVLQGEGVTLVLDSRTRIRKGITSSTFNSVPDAPISRFDLVLPEGPHSVLAANLPARAKGSMCRQGLAMPTAITAQNGAVKRQTTRIAVSGCATARRASTPKRARNAAGRGAVNAWHKR
ncbi:MAG: hypothetical protein ACHQC8_02850 [Solirubrobacterales bacterium]